jgi:hypothetical protein
MKSIIPMKNRKRLMNAVLIVLLFITFLLSPAGAPLLSYAVMAPYSYMHQWDSVLSRNKIKLNIPGGAATKKPDWYPFVITFNDNDGLSAYLGEDVEFTVLYNFGHFPPRSGTSSYYDPASPYYSSFYGGYIVKLTKPQSDDRRFGFLENGEINAEELSKIPEYDQKYLVLSSLGCPAEQRVFSENLLSASYHVNYAGYNDWVRIDSEIRTNSPAHELKGYQQGYLQYGKPLGRLGYEEDFPVISLKGRVYARYFDEYRAAIVLYIMAPSWETINECDRDILSKTSIYKDK